MNVIEILVFLYNAVCGVLLGRYGYSIGGIWLAGIFFVAGFAGGLLSIHIFGRLLETVSGRGGQRNRWKCSLCGRTDHRWIGAIGLNPVARCKCGKMYVLIDGKFEEVDADTSFDDIAMNEKSDE